FISSKSNYSVLYVFFFFQAEDGIRDYKVTGVQTCALPISHGRDLGKADEVGEGTGICTLPPDGINGSSILGKTCRDNVGKNRFRSEERRVGKEWRSRGAADH